MNRHTNNWQNKAGALRCLGQPTNARLASRAFPFRHSCIRVPFVDGFTPSTKIENALQKVLTLYIYSAIMYIDLTTVICHRNRAGTANRPTPRPRRKAGKALDAASVQPGAKSRNNQAQQGAAGTRSIR